MELDDDHDDDNVDDVKQRREGSKTRAREASDDCWNLGEGPLYCIHLQPGCAMTDCKVTPWYNTKEWVHVYHLVKSNRVQDLKSAIQHLLTWQIRSDRLPAGSLFMLQVEKQKASPEKKLHAVKLGFLRHQRVLLMTQRLRNCLDFWSNPKKMELTM